jgi:hypothetical protein
MPPDVFAAIVGILVNLFFLVLPSSLFGVKECENINLPSALHCLRRGRLHP